MATLGAARIAGCTWVIAEGIHRTFFARGLTCSVLISADRAFGTRTVSCPLRWWNIFRVHIADRNWEIPTPRRRNMCHSGTASKRCCQPRSKSPVRMAHTADQSFGTQRCNSKGNRFAVRSRGQGNTKTAARWCSRCICCRQRAGTLRGTCRHQSTATHRSECRFSSSWTRSPRPVRTRAPQRSWCRRRRVSWSTGSAHCPDCATRHCCTPCRCCQ